MTIADLVLIVLGICLAAFGVWLFRYLGRLSDEGASWVRGEFMSNIWVFVILGTWCGGLGMVAIGLGFGGMQ